LAAPGQPARLVAEQDRTRERELGATDRASLAIDAAEPVRYRHVRLTCGGHVLSEADNWYVPGRLTDAMNQTLEHSDTPFGRVVHALGFTRHTVSSRLLWSPLPADWTERTPPSPAGDALQIPDSLIENRAILWRADGKPFSLVVETYKKGLLAFPPPPLR